MVDSSGRSTDEIRLAVEKYSDMMYRIAYIMLGNESDAQDAVQDSLIKYITKGQHFSDENHEKAWMITVVSNICRDILRRRKRDMELNPELIQEQTESIVHSSGILEALMLIPENFRIVLTLYYVEERTITEIASIIHRTPSAVKMRLKKGRELLEKKYRKEFLDHE